MKKFRYIKDNVCLLFVLFLSTVLNLANITKEGYGNNYYAAGVKSMTMNLKNFFFVSFDPSGFVSMDKPPVGFWIQTIFAKILGFHGFSILLPQVVAGVVSVYLVYHIVKLAFGKSASLLSALFLAVTPVFVAASRNNTIDNLVVVTLLFSLVVFTKAVEKCDTNSLYISLILVGIGFNIKMLQAYMILPAIYITYLLSKATTLKKKIITLLIGTMILITVSLSWAFIVDFIPVQNRPYVGGSTNNRVLQLIFGHNGLERLSLSESVSSQSANITRLLTNHRLADQIAWFLPVALFGFLASAIKEKLTFQLNNKRKVLIVLCFLWFLPEFLYFSFSKGLFHPYYLTMLAPPIAILSGTGLYSMWQCYKEGNLKSWFLPITILIEVLLHLNMYFTYKSSLSIYIRSIILIALFLSFTISILLAVILILPFVKKKYNHFFADIKSYQYVKSLVFIALIGILITPLIGSGATIFYSMNSKIPCGGLELFAKSRKSETSLQNNNKNSELLDFLESNQSDEKYLLVVSSSQSAQNLILQSGKPILTLGGYSGSDPIMTLEEFKELVKNKEVRYVLTGGKCSGVTREIMDWVTKNGTPVRKGKYIDTVSNHDNNLNGKDKSQKTEQSNNGNDNMQEINNSNLFKQLNLYNIEDLYDLKGVSID